MALRLFTLLDQLAGPSRRYRTYSSIADRRHALLAGCQLERSAPARTLWAQNCKHRDDSWTLAGWGRGTIGRTSVRRSVGGIFLFCVQSFGPASVLPSDLRNDRTVSSHTLIPTIALCGQKVAPDQRQSIRVAHACRTRPSCSGLSTAGTPR